MGLFDNVEIDIPCSQCGRKTKKTIGWVQAHGEFTCACGTVIHLDADELRRELGKVDRAMDDLDRTFKKLSK